MISRIEVYMCNDNKEWDLIKIGQDPSSRYLEYINDIYGDDEEFLIKEYYGGC